MRRDELEDDLGCLSRPTLAAQSCLAATAFTSTGGDRGPAQSAETAFSGGAKSPFVYPLETVHS